VTTTACRRPCRIARNTQAILTVVAPCVLNCERGIPFKFRRKYKGQATLSDIPVILGGVKRDAHAYLSLQHKKGKVKVSKSQAF